MMTLLNKNTVITSLLIAIVLIAAWSTLSYHGKNTGNIATDDLPDAFMEEVTSIVMNKQGKPSMKIVTPKLVHYKANDRTDLTTPQLTLYRQSPQPWFITAKKAVATEGAEVVKFMDDVTIHHAADFNGPATVIKTATLLVHPNKKTAETTDPITLIQPDTTISATGMFADLNTGDIKLLSATRGEYAPTP